MVEKEQHVLTERQAAAGCPPVSVQPEMNRSAANRVPGLPSCQEEVAQALNAGAPSIREKQAPQGQTADPPSRPEEQVNPGDPVDPPLSPEEQVNPGHNLHPPSRQVEGSRIQESNWDSMPGQGSTDPEHVLLRRRNRQQRGIDPVESEEGDPGRGGPGPIRNSSSPQEEEGAGVCQRGYMLEAKLRSLPSEVTRGEELLMRELSARVQDVVRSSSWWERHGIDCTLIAVAFIILPAGFLCLRSENVLLSLMGVLILGVAHSTITVKGSHLASHGALTESKRWGKAWAAFFIEVCSAFPTQVAAYNHVKLHHAHTNIIGLGDSSVWKIPALNRYVYLFLAPLALPVLTPLAALGFLKEMTLGRAARTLCLISLGLCGHCWLLLKVSGFQTVGSALFFMFLTRAVLALPFIHVNIFQHIGLAMFSPEDRPKRIHQMSHGVLNLLRSPLLDWTFGHSLISCHVEHHLFPGLSDNMCLKIKPIVSQYLMDRNLPYHEDSYISRLRLFLVRYEELMVHMPPITQLVGIQ